MLRTLALSLLAACCAAGAPHAAAPAPRAVDQLDIQRYAGKWYEIARLPSALQRACVGDATVEYTPAPHGGLHINNRCRAKDGSVAAVSGTATRAEDAAGAQYQAPFLQPAGDYWVIGLDGEYRWAVVGSPDRKALWILARAPQLPPELLEQALGVARAQGYAVDELQYTPQR